MEESITFRFKRINSKEWEILDLGLNDYLDVDEGEAFRINSVAKYLNLQDYLDSSLAELAFIEVVLVIGNDRRTIKQTFWNDGNSTSIELLDEGEKDYHLLIYSSRFSPKSEFSEVIRLVQKEARWVPTYHGRFHELEDGSQQEEKIDLKPLNRCTNDRLKMW